MTDSEDYRARIIMSGRRAGKSKRISEARAQFDREQEVLGVLTGQVPVRSMPIACENHQPVQHRDGKPPWCRACGLTRTGQEPVSRLDSQRE